MVYKKRNFYELTTGSRQTIPVRNVIYQKLQQFNKAYK